MSKHTILIIGSGIAGVSAAEAARKQNDDCEIIMFTDETNLPVHRPSLPRVVVQPDDLKRVFVHDQAWFDERRIDVRLDTPVASVDAEKKVIRLEDGTEHAYDKLILATGSRSFVPPIKGSDIEGVFTLWTFEDAMAISDYAKKASSAVVIGGGLLGLEIAHALSQRKLHTTILERGDALLSRQLDERSSAMFLEQVERVGVEVMFNANTEEILADEAGKVKGLRLDDGRVIDCDLVMISTGVRARVEVMEDEPIEIDRRFVVNERLETNLPDIYAAGDCAVMNGQWYGLWSVSTREGRVAGANAAGGDETCVIPPPPYIVNTMETRIASAGDVSPDDPEVSSRIHFDEAQLTYDRRNFLGDQLTGYILLGDTTPFSMLSRELQQG